MSGQPSFSTTTIIFLIIGIIIGAGVGNYFTTNSLRLVINDYILQVSELTEEVSNLSQEVLDLEHEIGVLTGKLGDQGYWKTYSDHGVYFEYPSIHDLTIRNETDEIGLIFSFEQNDEGGYNYFHVNWSSPENITSIDEALDSLIALLEPFWPTMSSSIRINSTVYAHDMKYQYFTAPDIEGFTMNGINAFWHCENSNRDFTVEYYSNQQDTLADFYQNIESFECHSPEN